MVCLYNNRQTRKVKHVFDNADGKSDQHDADV
jgi:hypothetical protein